MEKRAGRSRRRCRIRVRQAVAGRHVHQDERVKGNPQPTRLHLLDRLHHREIGWRATIDRAILIVAADQKGIGPADAIHGPCRRRCGFCGEPSTPGPHLAIARAQIVAEPRHDEADALDFRCHRLQPVQRHHHVGGVGQCVEVFGLGRPAAALSDALRGIGELAGCRDHGHRLRRPSAVSGSASGRNTSKLSCGMRLPIATERQVLENDRAVPR